MPVILVCLGVLNHDGTREHLSRAKWIQRAFSENIALFLIVEEQMSNGVYIFLLTLLSCVIVCQVEPNTKLFPAVFVQPTSPNLFQFEFPKIKVSPSSNHLRLKS